MTANNLIFAGWTSTTIACTTVFLCYRLLTDPSIEIPFGGGAGGAWIVAITGFPLALCWRKPDID